MRFLARLYPPSRLSLALQYEDGDGRPRLNVHRASTATKTIGHWVVLKSFRAHRIARIDRHEYMDTCAPRVDDAGVQVDEFGGADRSVEVQVANVGGCTVTATPLRGDGAACLVYPFHQRRAVHDADHADISRPTRKR